jgi:hypothetical protein
MEALAAAPIATAPVARADAAEESPPSVHHEHGLTAARVFRLHTPSYSSHGSRKWTPGSISTVRSAR